MRARVRLYRKNMSFFSLVSSEPASKGKGLKKFNNFFLLNVEFVTKIGNYIQLKTNEMNHESINDDQIRRNVFRPKKELNDTTIRDIRSLFRR